MTPHKVRIKTISTKLAIRAMWADQIELAILDWEDRDKVVFWAELFFVQNR